jgi:chromosome segregation ATPase
LTEQQNTLFIAFQRHIEGSHSFLAVNFFLFLVDCLAFMPDWNAFILHTVAETQFCSLLAHVLTNSKNRVVLADACAAVRLIVTGLTERKGSALIESLVSGFLVVNSMTAAEHARVIDNYETGKAALGRQLEALEHEKEKLGSELTELSEAKQDVDGAMLRASEEIGASRQQIATLREKLRKKGEKYQKASEEVRMLGQEIAQLKVEIQHRDENIASLSEASMQMKDGIRELSGVDASFREIKVKMDAREREIALLQERLDQVQKLADANRTAADNELSGRRQAEAKLYDLTGQLNDLTVKLHDQETAHNETEKQRQKSEAQAKKKGDQLLETEESNRTLRRRISEMEDDVRTLAKATRTQKQEISALQQRITELEAQNRDHITLYQFIHKITARSTSFIDSSEEG